MTDSGKTTENDVYIYENTYYSLALSGFKIMRAMILMCVTEVKQCLVCVCGFFK